MRIKIVETADMMELLRAFGTKMKVSGHIEFGIDGTWFVIDLIWSGNIGSERSERGFT